MGSLWLASLAGHFSCMVTPHTATTQQHAEVCLRSSHTSYNCYHGCASVHLWPAVAAGGAKHECNGPKQQRQRGLHNCVVVPAIDAIHCTSKAVAGLKPRVQGGGRVPPTRAAAAAAAAAGPPMQLRGWLGFRWNMHGPLPAVSSGLPAYTIAYTTTPPVMEPPTLSSPILNAGSPVLTCTSHRGAHEEPAWEGSHRHGQLLSCVCCNDTLWHERSCCWPVMMQQRPGFVLYVISHCLDSLP